MKKLHTSALFGAAISMAAAPIFGALNASAASTYADYSQLNTNLNSVYSYTKVYATENTTVTVKKAPDAEIVDKPYSGSALIVKEGETASILIENSTATNAAGQAVDVLYKVDDVHAWENIDDNYVYLSQKNYVYGSAKDVHPTADDEDTQRVTIGAGDPVLFWINASHADGRFAVKFCQKGTYSSSSDDCTAATGLGKLSMMAWDFDVLNNTKNYEDASTRLWMDKTFNGDEGIYNLSGNAKIYYNTRNDVDGVEMNASNDGISVTSSNGAGFDGIYWANSAMVTADLTASSFNYRYTGTNCGIAFFFGSAVPYEMPKPTKSVDKTTAKVGDRVRYTITQIVPSNYSSDADIVAFSSLWSNFNNIKRSKNYTAFAITDTFDGGLTLPEASAIKIYNGKNVDVTSMFTIVVNGQKVTATAKTAELGAANFYGNTFRMIVDATVRENIDHGQVNNTATTTYTPDGGSPASLTSDEVQTSIQRHVTVIHIDDETEEEIAESEDKGYFNPGQSYTSDPSDDIPEHYVLVETPGNASGTVDNKDITIVYRYTPPRTVTVTHIDEQTGEEIAESSSEEYAKGDDYETEPSKDIPAGYVLVETPGNASGTVDDDVEVTYVYRKIKNPKTNDDSFGFMAAVTGATLVGAALVFTLMRRR